MRFQGEVAGVEEANKRTRIVPLERLGARRQKEGIVLAPHRQERRLVGPEILLEGRIERDVALVVTEQVELHIIGTGTCQIEVVEILTIWRHHRLVGYAVSVLPPGCLRREEGAERVSVLLRGVLPVGSDRTPTLAETFFVGVAVLRDNGSDPLRMADGEPEACRRAVVKDVHCKPVEADAEEGFVVFEGSPTQAVYNPLGSVHGGKRRQDLRRRQ